MNDENEQARKRLCTDWVASTEQGREFLWDLLSFCGVYQEVEGDHDSVLRGLGRRKVGLHILSILAEANEDIIFKMMKEAKERNLLKERTNERESRNNNNDRREHEYGSLDDFIGGDDGNHLAGYSNGGAIF